MVELAHCADQWPNVCHNYYLWSVIIAPFWSLFACLKELSEVEVMSPCFVCNSSKIRNTSHCDVLLTWKSISDLMMVTVCLTLNNTFKNGITDIDVSDDDKQICFGQCHATQLSSTTINQMDGKAMNSKISSITLTLD